MTTLPVPLPPGFEPKVKVKDKISEGSVLAEGPNPTENIVINLASDLNVPPDDIKKFLKKKPGDRVSDGDVIAEKGGLLGKESAVSNMSGTIVRLEDNGDLIVKGEEKKEPNTIVSPSDGEVEEVTKDQIVIKISKDAILGKKGIGGEATGEVVVDQKGEIDTEALNISVSGKILAGKKIGHEALSKALGLGAIGIIGTEILDTDLSSITQKDMKNPVIEIDTSDFTSFLKSGDRVIMDGLRKIIIKA